MRTLLKALVLTSLALPTVALADPPTGDEAKRTFDFLEKGQGQGIVIVDAKLCDEIPKKGDHAYECTTELTAGTTVGGKVNVWISYLVPKGDKVSDLQVQVKEGATVRETKDLGDLEGKGFLQRTWTTFTAKKAGNWSAVIVRGDKVIKTLSLDAK